MSTEITPEPTSTAAVDSKVAPRSRKHVAPKSGKAKRRHRATYPTPEFYLFAFFLNFLAVVAPGWLLIQNPTNLSLIVNGVLGILGMVIAAYSLSIRPKESNKKLRKVLVSITAAYGFILLLVNGFTILTSLSTLQF